MKQPLFSAIIIASLFIGCSESKNQSENDEIIKEAETTAVKTPEASKNMVKLKGVYTTSVRMPHEKYSYENLFDGDPTTYWASMPGAGPDEGIMLYFEKSQDISDIVLKQPSDKQFSQIENATIYINGITPIYRIVGDSKISIDMKGVRSLYLRISRLQDEKNIFEDNQEKYTSNFDRNKSAAIAEFELYNGDNNLKLLPPKKIDGKISASSTLEPTVSYGVRNLFDSRKEFAWVEGADGNGENESINIELEKEIHLNGLKISNGFQRSEKHYKANARLKTLEVSNEAGEVVTLNVKDSQVEQSLAFPNPLKGSKFQLAIKEAYPGTKYKDLAISDLQLLTSDGEVIINEGITEKIKTSALSQAKGTILENFIDRKFDTNEAMPDFADNKSIILRSDFTFVAYHRNYEGDQSEEMIADGNWEIKELNEKTAKIRVFGKFSKLSETFDYYAGDTETSFEQIFQDIITLDNNGVQGGKFIPSIKRITSNEE